MIHSCGWCHGDIILDNIFASGLLFDFSHAHTKSKLSEQAWEDFQEKDRRNLKSCFLEAVGPEVRCKIHTSNSSVHILCRN